MGRFLGDAQKAVREISPKGVIFLNAGSWSPGGWRVARDIQNVSPYQNFNGAEAFFHYTGSQNQYPYAMAGKYLRAGGKPAVVFMHYMNGSWHYLLLPPNEAEKRADPDRRLGGQPLAGAHPVLPPFPAPGRRTGQGDLRLSRNEQGVLHRYGERGGNGGALLGPHRTELHLDPRALRPPGRFGRETDRSGRR